MEVVFCILNENTFATYFKWLSTDMHIVWALIYKFKQFKQCAKWKDKWRKRNPYINKWSLLIFYFDAKLRITIIKSKLYNTPFIKLQLVGVRKIHRRGPDWIKFWVRDFKKTFSLRLDLMKGFFYYDSHKMLMI